MRYRLHHASASGKETEEAAGALPEGPRQGSPGKAASVDLTDARNTWPGESECVLFNRCYYALAVRVGTAPRL